MLTLAQYIHRQFADVSKGQFKNNYFVFQGCNFFVGCHSSLNTQGARSSEERSLAQ